MVHLSHFGEVHWLNGCLVPECPVNPPSALVPWPTYSCGGTRCFDSNIQQYCPLRIPLVYIIHLRKDWHIYFGYRISRSQASPSTGSPVLSNFSWYSWCLSCSINESTSSGTQSLPTQKWWNGNLRTTKIHCSFHLFTWKKKHWSNSRTVAVRTCTHKNWLNTGIAPGIQKTNCMVFQIHVSRRLCCEVGQKRLLLMHFQMKGKWRSTL